MKLDNLTITRRVPCEQYGHREIVGVYSTEPGDDVNDQTHDAVNFIEDAAKHVLKRNVELKTAIANAPAETTKKKVEEEVIPTKEETPAVDKKAEAVADKVCNELNKKAEAAAKKKEAAAKKAALAAEKKEAATKKKVKPYDRANDAHKEEFGRILEDIYGTSWKSHKTAHPEFYAKIVKASKELEGDAMFGADNEVLTSFINLITDIVGDAPAANDL